MKLEHHVSVTAAATSAMWKLFIAQFINTGVLLLVVNAQLKDIAFVAEPQDPLTPADCAPPDPDDAAAFFVQNG